MRARQEVAILDKRVTQLLELLKGQALAFRETLTRIEVDFTALKDRVKVLEDKQNAG
jgi:hypothetical protein